MGMVSWICLLEGGACLADGPNRHRRSFLRADGKWKLDEANTKRLASVGLVSGAVFTDIDGDGDPDLILACEWGAVRIFRNSHGVLTDATEALGLGAYTGWWNGIAAGDFDGDGRMDLIASNFGRNTKYRTISCQASAHVLRRFQWRRQRGAGRSLL